MSVTLNSPTTDKSVVLEFQIENWNLEKLAFEEMGKLEYLEKNFSKQEQEPTTNSIHI